MRISHVGGRIERLEPRRMLALSLVGDFNTTNIGSWAREPVVLDGVGYFYADDGIHGRELWKTDGTAAGTSLAFDFNPGPGSWGGFDLHEAGGLLYFSSDDSSNHVNIWRSDGTAEGTFPLTSVATANEQFLIEDVIELNESAIFGSYYWGLWKSDGTANGTERIAPVSVTGVARMGGFIYFLGQSLGGGKVTLWKSDGTATGTHAVREFSSPWGTRLVEANGRLYFWADDAAIKGGFEPWSSDGTAQGTVPLGDLVPGPASSTMAGIEAFNDSLYFTAETLPTPFNDFQIHLFRTDGTPAGTTHIAQVSASDEAYDDPGITVYDNAMYLRGGMTAGSRSLWRSDGTTAGTGQFVDLWNPSSFGIYDGRLYFKASTAASGLEMFSTDGTVQGTQKLREIAPGMLGIDSYVTTKPTVFNGRLFFRADDHAHGMEMWSTDGTSDGTSILRDLNTNTKDFNPGTFTPGPGGFHYFIANDGVRGSALWKTDGTAAGTSFVKSFLIVPPWYIGPFTYANGLLLFGAYDYEGSSGRELWRSDGTAQGTFVVADLAPGTASGMIGDELIKVGDRVFFLGRDHTSYPDLWVSDGTKDGTRLVKPNDSEFALENFSGMELDDKLIFQAAIQGVPEWAQASIFISDGTLEGTVPVKGNFRNFKMTGWTLFDGKAYFAATTITDGNELWCSDGTEEGTRLVADIYADGESSSPVSLVATPDYLYFTATDPVNGRELWRVNKFTKSPQRLTTLASDIDQVRASAHGGVVFTTAAGEIYRFDDSMLIPLKTRGLDVAPLLLGSDQNLDYFTAWTAAAGSELWQSDGTPRGTVVVHDLVPGPGSSYPTELTVIDDRVVVSAWSPAVGRELFVLSPPTVQSGGFATPDSMREAGRIIDLLNDDAPVTV